MRGIKRYMLEKIRTDDVQFISKTADNFQVDVTSVEICLKECLKEGFIERSENDCGYCMVTKEAQFSYEWSEYLQEDRIYMQAIYPLLKNVSKEAERIWSYAFMEMMNNALEHSECRCIRCHVRQDCLYTEISIADDGIGIFENIKEYLKERGLTDNTNQDAVLELYKGKLTTNAEGHSGEGIFFTSKMLDRFAIWSDNTIFALDRYQQEIFVQSHLISYCTKISKIGTMVLMRLENNTKRKTEEIFDIFAPGEEGFVRTIIPVKEVCPCGEPVARSQARRILYRLEEFKKIELDFSGVEFMGQGFADEIFRVFQNKHPGIELMPVNANPSVLRMISHVKR